MSEPIRVLHVLQRMEAAGTQALLMNLYRNIDRDKVQFDFLVEYPDKQFYDDEIIQLGGRIYYTSVRLDKNIIKFERQLKQILQEHPEYKVIHVHAFTIGYFVLRIAKKCGVPVRIAHSHNNETIHDSKYALKLIMQKLFSIHATDFFACSKEAGEYLFRNKKFHVLNNAIQSEKFIANVTVRNEVRKELHLGEHFTVGHVGRFHSQKNHFFLLSVFALLKKKCPDAKLLLVGTGDLESEIKKQVKTLSLEEDVLFLGNRKDMDRIYQAMDIFVLPSLFEGLGIVAVEAQSAGIPCVVSDGVSRNAALSPLICYMETNADESAFVDKILKHKDHELTHTNTQKYIIDAGFDVKMTAQEMQRFYLEKANKI